MTDNIEHSSTCGGCGEETFAFERYCHNCDYDTWEVDDAAE